MKKFYSFLVAAVVLIGATSCQKEATAEVGVADNVEFVASIAGGRTELGDGNKVMWNDGDNIRIYTQENLAGSVFVSDAEEAVASATFTLDEYESEPVSYFRTTILTDIVSGKMESAPYSGYLGRGYVDLALDRNTDVSFTASVPEDGRYLIDFIYGNANGPINTENKCAIRTLYVDGKRLGPVVMPHCGTGAFDTWRLTNPLEGDLTAGKHTFRLVYQSENCNMNILTNSAALDHLRLRRR